MVSEHILGLDRVKNLLDFLAANTKYKSQNLFTAIARAVSHNTRSNEHRRWEELYQQVQQSMEEFREQQGCVNEQMRELIIGLSRQMLQIANHAVLFGEVSSGNSNHSLSRITRIEFPKFWGNNV